MTAAHEHTASTTGPSELPPFEPGARVRVTQQVPRQARGGGVISALVTGTVVRFEQQPTGSWYAHGKNDKLWLDRLVLRKDDGEIVHLNLDQFSLVERA